MAQAMLAEKAFGFASDTIADANKTGNLNSILNTATGGITGILGDGLTRVLGNQKTINADGSETSRSGLTATVGALGDSVSSLFGRVTTPFQNNQPAPSFAPSSPNVTVTLNPTISPVFNNQSSQQDTTLIRTSNKTSQIDGRSLQQDTNPINNKSPSKSSGQSSSSAMELDLFDDKSYSGKGEWNPNVSELWNGDIPSKWFTIIVIITIALAASVMISSGISAALASGNADAFYQWSTSSASASMSAIAVLVGVGALGARIFGKI